MKGQTSPGAVAALSLLPTTRTLVDIHIQNNDNSAGLWDLYAGHREHLTRLVASTASSGRSGSARFARPERSDLGLAVLGAGNANDLDLATLRSAFNDIHLADLDGEALSRAVRRQDAETRARLVIHPGRDLSGLFDRLPAWRGRAPDVEALARAAPAAGTRVASQLPGPFDVVVSDCFISQVAWTCFRALGDGPLLMDVLDVVMAAHLRALVALTRPGGRCLLVSDVVSSDTVPLDRLFATMDGGALLTHLDQRGALFSGTSPSLAHLMLTHDPEIVREIEHVTLAEPWLWRVSQTRTVLVYALGFSRRAPPT